MARNPNPTERLAALSIEAEDELFEGLQPDDARFVLAQAEILRRALLDAEVRADRLADALNAANAARPAPRTTVARGRRAA